MPRPRPRSYSVVFLSDVPSAPEQEVVLQVEEEGMILAVVEMRCGTCGLQIQVSSLLGRLASGRGKGQGS